MNELNGIDYKEVMQPEQDWQEPHFFVHYVV